MYLSNKLKREEGGGENMKGRIFSVVISID